MSSLRRIRAGKFTLDMAQTLDDIQCAVSSDEIGRILLPVDKIFSEHPSVTLGEADARKCKNGALDYAENLSDGKYRFYGPDHEFLSLGEVANGEITTIKSFFEV